MKILVRAPNWIGDAVMAIAALEAIRRSRPGAEITVLSRPGVAELLRGQPFVDQVVSFESSGIHAGWAGQKRLIATLREGRFDAAVLLQNAFEAAWIAWRAGIAQRIGYARDGRRCLLTQAVAVPAPGEIPRHEVYYYLELLHRAGWIPRERDVPPIRLVLAEGARQRAEELLRRAGARENVWRCAIAPGASYGAAKCWPPERFAALADRFISECDGDVILFGGPGEADIAQRIASAMKGRAISLVGMTPVADLPALLSTCSAFVGNDSGAMHVAAAVGVPVTGIFGPTDHQATVPWSQKFELVREPASCSPCFLRKCPVDHRCMTRIGVDSVFLAARGLRGANQSARVRVN